MTTPAHACSVVHDVMIYTRSDRRTRHEELIPMKHYIPVKHDLSDLGDVLRASSSSVQGSCVICNSKYGLFRNVPMYSGKALSDDTMLQRIAKESTEVSISSSSHDDGAVSLSRDNTVMHDNTVTVPQHVCVFFFTVLLHQGVTRCDLFFASLADAKYPLLPTFTFPSVFLCFSDPSSHAIASLPFSITSVEPIFLFAVLS